MRRITLYLTTAALTFMLGWAGSFATGKITSVVDLIFSTSSLDPAIAPLPFPLGNEHEYEDAIYSVTIRRLFVGHHKKLVVLEYRTKSYANALCGNSEANIGTPNTLPAVEAATMENYFEKNMYADYVHVSNLGLEYRMISPEETLEAFSDYGGGWETFYERFPDSTGIIRFSRIGFNERHDQAFLYVENTCGSLCGSGSLVLLERHGDDWEIVKETPVWIS